MNLLEQITESGIVAVIRGSKPENIVEIGKALREGGVKALEITVETPKAMSIIEKVATELANEDVIVGAGTVLDPETARAAILSGARFVFSPTVNPETIKMSKRYGVLSIPGAFTPTEILTAYENGADLIKVFPAVLLIQPTVLMIQISFRIPTSPFSRTYPLNILSCVACLESTPSF